ncbi:hypothetical protein KRMM14A1259_29060 [Krasilnikovia sp. MM14-A1259]
MHGPFQEQREDGRSDVGAAAAPPAPAVPVWAAVAPAEREPWGETEAAAHPGLMEVVMELLSHDYLRSVGDTQTIYRQPIGGKVFLRGPGRGTYPQRHLAV